MLQAPIGAADYKEKQIKPMKQKDYALPLIYKIDYKKPMSFTSEIVSVQKKCRNFGALNIVHKSKKEVKLN